MAKRDGMQLDDYSEEAAYWYTEPGPYRTYGPVRGYCGHTHRTVDAAIACLARDQRGCERQGGYSDRRIVSAKGVGDGDIG